jgi:nanoRNase/pAp phosphatase (c-di-AMP/oligoRNAs hydrolase)
MARQRSSSSAPSHSIRRLLRQLATKSSILVTTHEHPDPDALAAAIGMRAILDAALPNAETTVAIKGHIGGGLNAIFARYSGKHTDAWNDEDLTDVGAIVLLDCQPTFGNSPLPPHVHPTAVIDHHPRARGRRFSAPFVDIRSRAGSTCSIVYDYFRELGLKAPGEVAAMMLFGAESDLAGVAVQPTPLDQQALSGLIGLADPRAYHAIKNAELPRSYFVSYHRALKRAMLHGPALLTHLGKVDSPEQPAVIADFLLRCEGIDCVLVTAICDTAMLLSLRSHGSDIHAGRLMSRLTRGLGEGGGHPTKAGGLVKLAGRQPGACLAIARGRFLRALRLSQAAHPLLAPEP